MCGIAGVVGASPDTDLEGVGRAMAASLSHRGPDASGVGVLPLRRGVFAHTRLRIIDLSERAAQPFTSTDGRVHLVFNGEIYDYRSHRSVLERDGVTFRSSSDTEVILETYRRRGLDGLSTLGGMFAFAIWDAGEDRLVLMRDRLGKKPLYWALDPQGALVFGSEVKALAQHPRLSLEIEPKHLPEYLAFGYVTTPRSLYRGVHKLPPGSRLVFSPGREPRIERYWSLDERVPRPERMTEREAKGAVREAIGRAVERRLVADVPVGAFLSGGIDSAIVVAEMSARSSARVRTFTAGFRGDRSYDERDAARRIAAHFGTDHTELEVAPSPADLLGRLLDHHDEPYGDSSAIALFAIAEATKRHLSVVLTGDGGDEVFAGYTRFRGDLVAGFIPKRAARLASRMVELVPEPRGYKHPLSLARRLVEHADRSRDEQLLAWNTYFIGERLRGLLRRELFPAFDPWSVLRDQGELLERSGERLDAVLRHNLATYLLDDLLVKADRMTMAVGLEARSPFLDTDLVELAFRIPAGIKMPRGRLKHLLREAYCDVLPREVLERKKHGFGVPVSRWWQGELREMVDDLLLSGTARTVAYLETEAVHAMVREHRSGHRDHGQRIFALVQLELWLRSLASRATQRGAQRATHLIAVIPASADT
jgi:asparagine synthase (glutamine-hydrolysing)